MEKDGEHLAIRTRVGLHRRLRHASEEARVLAKRHPSSPGLLASP